jgi:hypothetical protein
VVEHSSSIHVFGSSTSSNHTDIGNSNRGPTRRKENGSSQIPKFALTVTVLAPAWQGPHLSGCVSMNTFRGSAPWCFLGSGSRAFTPGLALSKTSDVNLFSGSRAASVSLVLSYEHIRLCGKIKRNNNVPEGGGESRGGGYHKGKHGNEGSVHCVSWIGREVELRVEC